MFRTELHPKPSAEKIALNHRVLTIGSCFADAMGSRLKSHKFQALINPFGTVYNPISIHQLMELALTGQPLPSHSFLQRGDVYSNYYFHSSFSSLKREELSERTEATLSSVRAFLQSTEVLIITYGTAWVYEHTDTKELVANCHKQPASLFTKRLLSQQEIVESFRKVFALLQKFSPNLRVILTLSPVRHIKDTLELNAVSKAVLRNVCYELQQQFSSVDYFPAYELMMDDLRDYRFYKSDMLHPTEDAEEYIWEKFTQTYFDSPTLVFIKKWKEINSAIHHKPFHTDSNGHQQFLKSLYTKVSELKSIVNVEEELAIIQSQISTAR